MYRPFAAVITDFVFLKEYKQPVSVHQGRQALKSSNDKVLSSIVGRALSGEDPAVSRHAAGSWPSNLGPANPEEWKHAVWNFRGGLDKLESKSREVDLLGKIGKTSRLRMLHTIASHTSYHTGQVVLLRQLLGKWPPPSGGLTW